MKNFVGFFVFALLLTNGICQNESTTAAPTETTTEQTTVDTTTSQSTTTKVDTTTRTDTTTVAPTTASTAAPTTPSTTSTPTTTPSTTSTSAPTTTPSTTSTSTTVKTTTTVVTTVGPTTPTPEPPTPEMGEWNVTDNNVTCIRADLKVRFKIPVGDKFEYIALSPNATNSGSSCNSTNGTQVLSLIDSDYKLSLTFDKDGNTKIYVKEIKFSCTLPGISLNVATETPQFSVQSGSSYLCNTGSVDLENVTMEIMHIQLQAFGSESTLAFGLTEECEADNKVDDLVPIVVGCALLALVVIVLVAYFVGRRRSRQKGYQSV